MQLGALEGDVDTGDPPPPFDLAAGGGKGHLPALSTHAVLIDSAAASDLKDSENRPCMGSLLLRL